APVAVRTSCRMILHSTTTHAFTGHCAQTWQWWWTERNPAADRRRHRMCGAGGGENSNFTIHRAVAGVPHSGYVPNVPCTAQSHDVNRKKCPDQSPLGEC